MTARPELRFYFGLARELGMSVGRLLDEVDSREIAGWMAFFNLEQEDMKKPKQEDPKLVTEKIKSALGGYGKVGKQKSRKPTR